MPTIVFKVNLENPRVLDWSQPYGSADAANFRTTRSTFFPDFLKDNHKLKHGDQFTYSGMQAVYLKNNFTAGEFKFLDIVSQS